ncbi:MAG: FTR1 family protein [Galbitalea sp.]
MLATLVIGLREGLEAALIVGIIAAFLRKNGKSLLPMWIGVAVAVGLSIAVGVGLGAIEQALPQAGQEAMESVIGAVAVVFVTGMIVWMNANARGMKKELEAEAAEALSQGGAYALAGMAFLAVLKEGFETSVFLLATFSAAQSAALAATGAVIGVLIAVGIGIGIYAGGVRLNLGRFFRATGAFLILVAAGLVITMLRTAHEAGWINAGQQTTVNLSWLVQPGTVAVRVDHRRARHPRGPTPDRGHRLVRLSDPCRAVHLLAPGAPADRSCGGAGAGGRRSLSRGGGHRAGRGLPGPAGARAGPGHPRRGGLGPRGHRDRTPQLDGRHAGIADPRRGRHAHRIDPPFRPAGRSRTSTTGSPRPSGRAPERARPRTPRRRSHSTSSAPCPAGACPSGSTRNSTLGPSARTGPPCTPTRSGPPKAGSWTPANAPRPSSRSPAAAWTAQGPSPRRPGRRPAGPSRRPP